MLLTLSTTHRPATDLGYLLAKHPDRVQQFELSFGKAHVFYPHAAEDRCTAALLLDVDPVGMVRGKNADSAFLLGQYVNDRPYAASSLMSVAISQVFGSALNGRCNARPELLDTPLPLEATLAALPVRGGEAMLHRIFAPLGYTVAAQQHPLDERFPDWGESPYFTVTLAATTTVAALLAHVYVLIPVFDNQKHYFVGDDELEKLLTKGGAWLAEHLEKEYITRRYLKNRPNLVRQALARLVEEEADDEAAEADEETTTAKNRDEEVLEKPISLNTQRLGAVLAALRACGATSVVDLGCGEGKLLSRLLDEKHIERILGLDVSARSLEIAERRLKLDRVAPMKAARLKLVQGSLTYRDERLASFDAAAVVEVIEHLDPPRLAAFERVLFEFARPKTVVLTTPNREYNVKWESLPAGKFRHNDHRFEWTRAEFQSWSDRAATRHGYRVRFVPVGPVDEALGPPTQMGVFERD